MIVGYGGSGTYTQSGGTTTFSTGNGPATLCLGFNPGSSGVYSLSGSGFLSAGSELVGWNPGTTGLFRQSGGSNAVGNLSIGSGGLYQLSGGTLQVTSGIINAGAFDGMNDPATLIADCSLDLTSGTWQNLGQTFVRMGTGTLLVVPPGFNPATAFAGYQSLGLTHTAGTTLVIPAGQSLTCSSTFSINDPVVCLGSITAVSPAAINLNNGLMLSSAVNVSLGAGP